MSPIIQPQSHDNLVNPYHYYPEDDLQRIQSDLPRETVAYINSLFGRRGQIQQIINTVFFYLEHECKSLGLRGYDPVIDHDRIIAGILSALNGAGEQFRPDADCRSEQSGPQPNREADTNAIIECLVGSKSWATCRQPDPVPPQHSAAPNHGRKAAPRHDNSTADHENSSGNKKRKPANRSGAASGKTSRRKVGAGTEVNS